MIEQQCTSDTGRESLYISPFVLLYMLEFLCWRHVDLRKAQIALNDLQVMVNQDWKSNLFSDMSWEILGICQQIAGNHHAAIYSYQQSLRQIQFHKIQDATRLRIALIS